MKYCNHCQNPTRTQVFDDSFDYAGTHCTHGKPGTHHDSHVASECCEENVSEGIMALCQCGNEIEIHPDTDLNWLTCQMCKRTGHWSTDY